MSVIGADWAGGVWVVAVADDDGVTVEAEPSFLNVVQEYDPAWLLVDIPIHLDETPGLRGCDAAAREIDAIQNSVFRVPGTDTLESDGYVEGLGSTCWSLVFQIREVRAVIESDIELPEIVESHPELCFHGLDPESVEASKQEPGGQRDRIEALANGSVGGEKYREEFERVEKRAESGTAWQHRIGRGRLDDVLDAMAMARAAELAQGADGLDVLPETETRDSATASNLDSTTPHMVYYDAD